MPLRAFIDSDDFWSMRGASTLSSVLMPLRAFIDSDLDGVTYETTSKNVLMPLRAFIDSDLSPPTAKSQSTLLSLNALAGIY